MRGPVVDDHECSKHLMTQKRTLLATGMKSLFACEQKLLVNGPTVDSLLELVAFEGTGRLQESDDSSVVASPTRLLLEEMIEIDLSCHRLPVRNLRLTGFARHFIFSSHSFHVNIEMELAHAGDDGLLTFLVDVNTECRVFLLKPIHSLRELGRICGVLRLDR